MKLMTNAPKNEWCWHQYCTTCLDRLLMRQQKFQCLKCSTLVKRSTLDARSRDEIEVERDVLARRKVLAVFNKPQSSFESDKEYNDYCERREDLVADLCAGGDVAKSVQETLKKYQSEHSSDVARNASEKAERERVAALKIKASRALAEAAAQRQRDQQRRVKMDQKIFEKQAMQFQLGDRPNMPAAPRNAAQADSESHLYAVPVPVETLRDRPKRVQGDELRRRRLAADWKHSLFAARALADLDYEFRAAAAASH